MSDISDGSGPVPRRTPRTSDGGAPVSGALAIVLAVIAVVAGFLILRSISGDDDRQLGIQPGEGSGAIDTGDDADSTTLPGGTAASTVTPATTQPAKVTEGAAVIVANANGIPGSAGQMSRALGTDGYDMGDPTDAAGLADPLAVTIIYFDTSQVAAQAVAASVGRSLGGGVEVLALPSGTPPVQSGSLDGSGVLVMLGLDKANKTLAELNPTADTSPVQLTNPDLSVTSTSAPN